MFNKIIILTSITIGIFILLINIVTIDGCENIYLVFLRDDTKYSERYSDEKWKSLKTGMKHSEVKNLVGNPLSVNISDSMSDERYEYYSHSPNDTHCRIRILVYKDEILIKIISGIYID